MKTGWIAITGCSNSCGGKNMGEQKRTWALVTNPTGVEDSTLL